MTTTVVHIGSTSICSIHVYTSLTTAGAAYQGGLRQFDRILEINSEDVQGAKHAQVHSHVTFV